MSEISYICPSCQSNVTVSLRARGKTLPCPHCVEKAIVPNVVADEAPIIFSGLKDAYAGVEPWYYAFLVFYAYLTLALGFIAIGFVVVVAILGAALSRSEAFAWLSIGLLMQLFFVGLAIIFFSAVILLGVDMGRSLRVIRRSKRS